MQLWPYCWNWEIYETCRGWFYNCYNGKVGCKCGASPGVNSEWTRKPTIPITGVLEFMSFCNIKEGGNQIPFCIPVSPNGNEQLKSSTFVCTTLKTTFNTYASFHISVVEEDIPLTNHMCLAQQQFNSTTLWAPEPWQNLPYWEFWYTGDNNGRYPSLAIAINEASWSNAAASS
jgi:hypothetical protein